MKGTSNQEKNKLKTFYLNCTKEEMQIIKQGLGHLQINYMAVLEEKTDDHVKWIKTNNELSKVNKLINELKTIENE